MKPNEIYDQKILLSPLNWGYGHVARCIGLVHQLKSQGNQIFVACSADQAEIFKQYFNDLMYVDHAPYPFKFKGKGKFSWDLLVSWPALKQRRAQEHLECEKMVEELNIDLILSDHRYGFYSKKIASIFITHQLNLPVSGIEAIVQQKHKSLMNNFRQIWVMDFEDSRLAGSLSVNKADLPVEYIGPYSRFSLYENLHTSEKSVTVLIASGPDVYAQQLIDSYKESETIDFIIGREGLNPYGIPMLIDWREQDKAIINASKLISRSGYSTIMDQYYLKKPEVVFTPTPGQDEQVYLSSLL